MASCPEVTEMASGFLVRSLKSSKQLGNENSNNKKMLVWLDGKWSLENKQQNCLETACIFLSILFSPREKIDGRL